MRIALRDNKYRIVFGNPKDVPSMTIFSNSMFIFLIGQLQILASALQEMRISSFRTEIQRLSKVLSDQEMPTGIIPNSFSRV